MNHKYGFHVNQTGGSTGNAVLEAVRRIQPKVVKVLDPDVDFCKKVRDLAPDVFLIGRVVVETSEQDRFALAPAETGRKFAERMLNHQASKAQHNGKLLLNAWESYNEALDFGNASGDRKRQYDEFLEYFAGTLEPTATWASTSTTGPPCGACTRRTSSRKTRTACGSACATAAP